MTHNILFILGAMLAPQLVVASTLNEDWLIRPGDGLGRIHGIVTYGTARRLYPDANSAIEMAYSGFKLPPNPKLRDYSTESYFIFRKDGEVLFRSECYCKSIQKKEKDDAQRQSSDEDLEKRIMHPVAVSPRFRTKEGIHVGSTVGDLRRAFPSAPELFAIRGTVEYACFGASVGGLDWEKKPSITKIAYFLNPAPGKNSAGNYSNHDYTKLIDDNAVIIAIDPRGGCVLPEEDGPED